MTAPSSLSLSLSSLSLDDYRLGTVCAEVSVRMNVLACVGPLVRTVITDDYLMGE